MTKAAAFSSRDPGMLPGTMQASGARVRIHPFLIGCAIIRESASSLSSKVTGTSADDTASRVLVDAPELRVIEMFSSGGARVCRRG